MIEPKATECVVSVENHLEFPIRTHLEDTGSKIVIHIYKADTPKPEGQVSPVLWCGDKKDIPEGWKSERQMIGGDKPIIPVLAQMIGGVPQCDHKEPMLSIEGQEQCKVCGKWFIKPCTHKWIDVAFSTEKHGGRATHRTICEICGQEKEG